MKIQVFSYFSAFIGFSSFAGKQFGETKKLEETIEYKKNLEQTNRKLNRDKENLRSMKETEG